MAKRLLHFDGAFFFGLLNILLLLQLQLLPTAAAQENCNADGSLCDQHESCRQWQSQGECFKNKAYMSVHCPVACQEGCSDSHPRCQVWATLRECEENPLVMQEYCPQSCGYCTECQDKHELCSLWAEHGECDNNPVYMNAKCPKSCHKCKSKQSNPKSPRSDEIEALLDWTSTIGIRQSAVGSDANRTLAKIQATKDYWEQQQQQQAVASQAAAHQPTSSTAVVPQDILDKCFNREALCSFWALLGECENNPNYMTTSCAPACLSCDQLALAQQQEDSHDTEQCPPDDELRPALRPGNLNKLMERIVQSSTSSSTTPHTDYSVRALSRPSEEPATEVNIVVDKSLPPWVLQLDDFMTLEESKTMIQLDPSMLMATEYDSVSCSVKSGCRDQDLPGRLHQRLARTLQMPTNHTASFLITRYSSNSNSNNNNTPRHDFLTAKDGDDSHKSGDGGPRILSFVVYLSSSDDERGGGIHFPQLDITVQRPRPGTALLWPNVYNSDPMKRDPRLMYQQLLPIDGTNFVLQGSIHMYDIVTPESNGCLSF